MKKIEIDYILSSSGFFILLFYIKFMNAKVSHLPTKTKQNE
jgi:hypothetical protein